MSRALKYQIPGFDCRLDVHDLARYGWPETFPRPGSRLVVEVGFGRGEFLIDQASRNPETSFVGIEVSHKRCLKMARRLARTEITNVRLLENNAERVMGELFDEASIACCWINFPDPWPKKRHHRRRLVQRKFVGALAHCLEPDGVLYVTTDHEGYAEAIHECLSSEDQLRNAYGPEPYRHDVEGRMQTRYEVEWRSQQRTIHYFMYKRRRVDTRIPAA
ncbi:tRNA (guanosine(46)-N7)-methyltransferase TrmB [Myxococcota bacterium]|nr:tRNA (guanosine(46)-N7)-methyltransferase TrmB [Myxococcota bacterium]